MKRLIAPVLLILLGAFCGTAMLRFVSEPSLILADEPSRELAGKNAQQAASSVTAKPGPPISIHDDAPQVLPRTQVLSLDESKLSGAGIDLDEIRSPIAPTSASNMSD